MVLPTGTLGSNRVRPRSVSDFLGEIPASVLSPASDLLVWDSSRQLFDAAGAPLPAAGLNAGSVVHRWSPVNQPLDPTWTFRTMTQSTGQAEWVTRNNCYAVYTPLNDVFELTADGNGGQNVELADRAVFVVWQLKSTGGGLVAKRSLGGGQTREWLLRSDPGGVLHYYVPENKAWFAISHPAGQSTTQTYVTAMQVNITNESMF